MKTNFKKNEETGIKKEEEDESVKKDLTKEEREKLINDLHPLVKEEGQGLTLQMEVRDLAIEIIHELSKSDFWGPLLGGRVLPSLFRRPQLYYLT